MSNQLPDAKKVFFPNLDGLRFFAFFAVFVNHAMVAIGLKIQNKNLEEIKNNFLSNGDLGVEFFFVLSGFLITYLLLKEKEESSKVNIPHFYLRRVLRIWPVYFIVVGLCLYFFPLLKNHLPGNFPISVSTHQLNPYLYLTFTGNFDYLINGISNVLIGVLWSVSVEEQFYLFWPLIIAFIPTKHLLKIFTVIILGSIAFRYFYAKGDGMIIHYHSLSSVSDLATGAVIALLAFSESFINKIKAIPKYVIVLTYIIGLAMLPLRLFTWEFGIHYGLVSSFVPVIISAFFAFIILEQNYSENSFYKISKFKLISSLGRYTYAMYCYHMIVYFVILYAFYLMGINVFNMDKPTFICVVITSFFTTILVSILSYHIFEIQFLKLKKRFTKIETE